MVIDALDGAMGLAIDAAGIQFRFFNTARRQRLEQGRIGATLPTVQCGKFDNLLHGGATNAVMWHRFA